MGRGTSEPMRLRRRRRRVDRRRSATMNRYCVGSVRDIAKMRQQLVLAAKAIARYVAAGRARRRRAQDVESGSSARVEKA